MLWGFSALSLSQSPALKQKTMHHVRLRCFWIWWHLFMSDCRNKYTNETWCDNEWDGEEAHAKRLSRSWTNTRSTLRKRVKGTHSNAPSSKDQDHWSPCILFHAKVKTCYTESISSLSNTLARHKHHSQPVHVSSVMLICVMSCLGHITTMGHTYCDQCNVKWKSKRPTFEVEESCKVEKS